jgi:hypothetical protein
MYSTVQHIMPSCWNDRERRRRRRIDEQLSTYMG